MMQTYAFLKRSVPALKLRSGAQTIFEARIFRDFIVLAAQFRDKRRRAAWSFFSSDASYFSNPNTATPVCVPTYTLPFAIIGVMNLFPGPNWSRPFAAWLLS